MRRIKATLIYRRTRTLRAVQLLFDRTKLESTVRHLGIEVDDALEISEQIEIWQTLSTPVVRPSFRSKLYGCSAMMLNAYNRPIGDSQH